MNAPLHIGIVACSAEGAALCYRTICAEGELYLGRHGHPEVSMHTHSLADYVRCLDAGDLEGVAALMLASAHKLAAAGAQFLICPDNTIHQALPLVLPQSPLPWLNIADEVAAAAVQRGYRKLGILGTRWLVESDVYPAALAARGLAYELPPPDSRGRINQIIMFELVRGVFRGAAIGNFQRDIEALKARGCDAVVLACTELPIILNDDNSPLPTLDSTRLLARAALRRALPDVPMKTLVEIVPFEPLFQRGVIDVILPIQQQEFGFRITVDDQPDLLDIGNFYQSGAGNFWVAIVDGEVVGTIALRDLGNGQGALRKMFVKEGYRGRVVGVAQRLFETLLAGCRARGVREVFLGTTEKFQAAHRFYEKHGFRRIEKDALPAAFPFMAVDTRFYARET